MRTRLCVPSVSPADLSYGRIQHQSDPTRAQAGAGDRRLGRKVNEAEGRDTNDCPRFSDSRCILSEPTSTREFVVWTLHLLGGVVSRIHTEDKTRKEHEIFPDSIFSTGFPVLPDKGIVRVAFIDALKSKHGAFVKGCTGQHRGRSSWTKRDPQLDDGILTAAGVKWILLKQQRSEGIGRLAGHLKKHWPKVLKQLECIRARRLMADFVTDPADFSSDFGGVTQMPRRRTAGGLGRAVPKCSYSDDDRKAGRCPASVRVHAKRSTKFNNEA